jgi:mono/diheme cytochrome c family protein
MNSTNHWVAWATLACLSTLAGAETAPAESRGALLYNTHCVACHTVQMHWRNDRQAVDWDSLKFQVRRWQGNAGLAWDDADIAEVARYLNEIIYHHPQVNDRVGLVPNTKLKRLGLVAK